MVNYRDCVDMGLELEDILVVWGLKLTQQKLEKGIHLGR